MKFRKNLIVFLILLFVISGSAFAERLALESDTSTVSVKLKGVVAFNQIEGGFYEIEGYRLISPVDFSKYLGQELLVIGKIDDSPSIQMVKAIKVHGFRVLNGDNEELDPKKIKIFMNGVEVTSDVAPVLKNNRVLIPVRVVTEKLGAHVEWDDVNHTVLISNKYMTIKLVVGSNKALVYHKYDFSGIPEEVMLDQPAEIIDNRTFVPLRFIFERFDALVSWEKEGRLVLIESEISYDKEIIDTGTYVGQIDNNFVEIKISGVPEEIGTKSFQLSDELKERFDSLGLKTNDTVRFTYISRENENRLLLNIEKI